jgi:hypothetical protein
MAKTWVLDTDTKGTGAHVVPLENALEQKEPERPRKRAAPKPPAAKPVRREPKPPVRRSASPLAPGQVRKKATGEIGKIQSVDSKAGTATVRWLKQGRTSTVPLTAITRR